RPLLRLTFDWHHNDRQVYKYVESRCREMLHAMGSKRTVSHLPKLPGFEIHNYKSTHPTGGAIMGSDPGNSVTNSYGQVWDTPNVFVTGAALYPQNPGANPTGTVAALAYRAGDAIRDKYCGAPNRIIAAK